MTSTSLRFGVDLNRNWGVAFGDEPGSSGDRCSDSYRGPDKFSEYETEAVRRFTDLNPVTVNLDVHSYGNVIAGPWAHTDVVPQESGLPDDVAAAADELAAAVASAASSAASATGASSYSSCKGSCGGLGLAAGVAPDFFTGPDKIGLTMELRSGSGGGLQGFVLPEDEIVPTGTELLAAVEAILEFLESKEKH